MAKREFLMLATVFDPDKFQVGGYYMSEKLDGVRCFWDGGVTRGVPTTKVPWAGVLDQKTGQLKSKLKQEATGLWSRYGNPVMAPDWFLNTLPACPLDGELYAGRGKFQKTCSVIRKDVPDDKGWGNIQFAAFSTPSFDAIFADGEIKNAHQKTDIRFKDVERFMGEFGGSLEGWVHLKSELVGKGVPFHAELAHLVDWIDTASDTIYLVKQTKLPEDNDIALGVVMEEMGKVLEAGGEGLILRGPDCVWTPKRVKNMLKVKGYCDDEGVVVGFTSGRETTKGSKLLGKIGALILDHNGKRLALAGLTDEEREFSTLDETTFATRNPGVDMPNEFQGKHFKVGDRVTFLYRELTKDGVPKEARYFRQRKD